ncbi:MAG: type III-A CRISPR-associated RAMP protein Csm4 [Desulfomonilaceae bacterium]
MKLYDVTIHPLAAFGTPLKGDTLFGQFCWQVAYDPDLVDGGLEPNLDRYCESPFMVVSSAYPKIKLSNGASFYALKKPDLPFGSLFPDLKTSLREQVEKKKVFKSKKWMFAPLDLRIDLKQVKFVSDSELLDLDSEKKTGKVTVIEKTINGKTLIKSFAQPHNSINRITSTTGGSPEFAPYQTDLLLYRPGTLLSFFVLIDENVTDIERIVEGFTRIGSYGFGKDASIGKGKFRVQGFNEVKLAKAQNAKGLYCLGPCAPRSGSYDEAFFQPFVRFGRHGDRVASSQQPFKNPVIMADEGAVFMPSDRKDLTSGYFGIGLTGVSRIQPKAVAQGYSITLALELEV